MPLQKEHVSRQLNTWRNRSKNCTWTSERSPANERLKDVKMAGSTVSW